MESKYMASEQMCVCSTVVVQNTNYLMLSVTNDDKKIIYFMTRCEI